MSILLNAGDGTFGPPVAYFAERSPSQVAMADIDGDGRLDIVAVSDGRVVMLLNRGCLP